MTKKRQTKPPHAPTEATRQTVQQLESWPTDSLIEYARNPRKNNHAVDRVAAAIREFGFRVPILAKSDKTIVDGHLRLKAAKKLGLEEVPVLLCDDMTDLQVRAFRLSVNKVSEFADWDDEMLRVELDELGADGFDLELTGFSLDEIADLQIEEVSEGLTDEDAVPEPPEIPVTVLGDIWLLGNHRLMCGDSTSIDAVEKLMDGQKADMVFTDPPYNVDYGGQKHPTWKRRSIQNDNMSKGEFADFCAAFTACIKASCPGCIYVFGPSGPDGRIMFTALDEALHCSTTVVWNKDRFVLGRGKYHNKYEPCWFGWNDSGIAFIDDRKLTNVWDFKRPTSSKLHPTMKPVELVENALGHASNVGGKVLDLFGGSGTTMIASEKSNRNCYMMELDPIYADVIVQRWQDFTGKEATHAESGKTYAQLKA